MHIAIFSDSYLPYTSGVVRSIVTFSKELRALGHKVSIFAPSYGNKQQEKDVYRFLSFRAPTFKEFALAIPLAPSLSNKLKQIGVDIIHVHSPFMMGRLGARCARKLQIPLVSTYHTLYEEYAHYSPLAPSLVRKAVRYYTVSFSNRCQLVITPTDSIVNYLRKNGVTAPITAIPTGIELDRFNNADPTWLRKRLNLPPGEIVLIHVGRLGKEKNITFVLQAFARVHQLVANTRLLLVGGGPLRASLESQAESLGIKDAVTFAGSFSFAEMPAVYAGADLFVFASVTETQGLVVAEAKAAGLPVVVVKAYGVQEMVNDGEDGFLTPLDQNLFTEAILRLVNDASLRQQMGRKAYRNVHSLSSQAMAKKLLSHYQALLKPIG
ncbi:MAG: glycosyltransferase family 4 protein [Clostridia bacterium]|nr:glycosyltransferase family 4 protein [Clostridia bacterium]